MLAHGDAGLLVKSHLGEKKSAVGVDAAHFARRGSASVETPVPGSEDENVGDPEGGCRLEQGNGRLPVGGQRGDEQAERPDHVESDDGGDDDAEDAVEGVEAAPMRKGDGDGENDEDDEQEPVGAVGKGFGEGKAEATDSKEGERGGPAGLDFYFGFCRGRGHGSEVTQVVENFGGGPVLGADEFAADDAAGIDDVGFGRARGIEGSVGLVAGVVNDGHVVEIVVAQVLTIVSGRGIEGDGEDDCIGHLLLDLLERRPLRGAVDAPAGPEIEDDSFAAVIAEDDGLRAVVDDDGGSALAHLSGVGGAVAALEQDTGHGVEGAENSEGQELAAEAAPEIGTAEHVPIIK